MGVLYFFVFLIELPAKVLVDGFLSMEFFSKTITTVLVSLWIV